ncbi:MAG: hypothetical protein QM698_15280 [Micropepsaceae bacterium]
MTIYPGEQAEIDRTATTLLRRYGDRARAEALVWCRHFAEAGEAEERRVWTRIALAVRDAARSETANDNETSVRA